MTEKEFNELKVGDMLTCSAGCCFAIVKFIDHLNCVHLDSHGTITIDHRNEWLVANGKIKCQRCGFATENIEDIIYKCRKCGLLFRINA